MAIFKLPTDDKRVAVIGKTGSGKTQAAVWQLSERSWHSMPWIIFDFKRDKLINQIPGVKELSLGKLPEGPGLHIVHPVPGQEEEVEKYFWQIWQHENIGLFIDEGYMIGDSEAFRALLTQGRSKSIPMIILTQRPSWLSLFVFSEADYYQVFYLNMKKDRQKVNEFVPIDFNTRLPEYHSIWYDVNQDKILWLRPVPSDSVIIKRFQSRQNAMKDDSEGGSPEATVKRLAFI